MSLFPSSSDFFLVLIIHETVEESTFFMNNIQVRGQAMSKGKKAVRRGGEQKGRSSQP